MLKDIVIIGAGGHAKEIAFLIEEINRFEMVWNLKGFLEKGIFPQIQKVGKYSIFDEVTFLREQKSNLSVVVAIGNPQKVKSIYECLQNDFDNITFPNLIHPSVLPNLREVRFGKGNIICMGTIFTTDIQIGSFNCLNRACNISHDVVIGNYCTINPGVNISGGVRIDDCALIGTGATILQYLTIGESAVVGAGAVVTKNVLAEMTVIGVPAKAISK